MLDPKLEAALNQQINHEMHSAYDYLAMSAYCEHLNLIGFAKWMQQQRQEELTHAMRLYQYLLDRGGQLDLGAVEKPICAFKSIHDVFGRAVKIEQRNTKAINDLYALALELKDYATQQHLHWFLQEQVEEEKLMKEVLGLLDIAGDNPSALLVINRQLGERTGDPAVQ